MQMKLVEIPRVKAGDRAKKQVKELSELNQERLLLATRATDLLGYNGLMADVTGETQFVTPGPLAEALRALEIEVLDTATVIEYQMQEMVRATQEKILDGNLDSWAYGYFAEAGWMKTPLNTYTHPIPEFVIDKAVRIKERAPEVKFYVQHLRDPKADPFLIAYVGKEIYYVEAWDEPRFEGRLR